MSLLKRRKDLHREYEQAIREIWRCYERDMHKAWINYLEKKEAGRK
jgi:hypothetical protein